MIRAAASILDLIGNTPIVDLPRTVTGVAGQVLCKLDILNPTGSIKDRMAKYIIQRELERGRLSQGDTICDNTSGNAGASIAMVASVSGLKSVITTPEKTSREKTDLMRSYGAEVIVTPDEASVDDPRHCYQLAKRLSEERGYYWLNQYDNPLNPEAHYKATGPEIWQQCGGKLTHFLMGIGTGGTISGVGRYLKEQNPNIRIIGVEPRGSLFTAIHAGETPPEPEPCKVEGIGTDKPVAAFHKQYIDRVIQIGDNEAFLAARFLTRTTGISVGGSTGSAFAALSVIQEELGPESCLMFLACDSGIRYITKFFSDDWMRRQGMRLETEEEQDVPVR
ncbi:MAG: cysteine synthase family protein [bacterium]